MSDIEAGHNAGISKLILKKGKYEIYEEPFEYIIMEDNND